MSNLRANNEADLVECSECGHQHFNGREYLTCPLTAEGCDCPKNPKAPVKHWADHCPTAKRGDVLHVPEDEADCTTCSPAAIDASEPCCITSAQTRGAQHHVTCEEY